MFLHNQTQSDIYYFGVPVKPGIPFEIESSKLNNYKNSIEVNTGLLNGDIKVSLDGATLINDPMTGLNTLKRTLIDFEKKDALGYPAIVTEAPAGDFDTLVSHNWCDKNSWSISATDSTWEIAPSANKVLEIGKSEVQFEHDISITEVTKLFIDYYIWHPAYPGTPVVGKTVEIDSARKIFELGNAHYHAPAIGTEIPSGMTTVQFNYRRALTLHSVESALKLNKIVFRLEADGNGDHKEAGGSYCTVGLVVTESDE